MVKPIWLHSQGMAADLAKQFDLQWSGHGLLIYAYIGIYTDSDG